MNLRDEFDTIQNRRSGSADRIAFFVSGLLILCSVFHVNASVAASNVVEVPAVISLPLKKKDLDNTLAKYLGQTFATGYEINQLVSDVVIRDPFEIRLSGIRVTGNLQGRTEVDSRGVIGEAVLRGLKISIEKVSIHTVIRSVVGGVDARIRLDAECTNTVVDWRNTDMPLFLRAAINVGALQPSLDIEGLTLSTLFQSPSEKPVMEMNCTGPAGIETILQEQAWNTLIARWTDVDFLEDVQSAIESSINAGLRPGGEGFSISAMSEAGMKLQLKASSYKIDVRGAHLMGLLRFELDRPTQGAPPKVNPETLLPSTEVNAITLSLATDAVEAVLQSYFAEGIWNHWTLGKDILGFRELMSSRFSQLFAFPALMDFPKDAPMAFSTSLTGRMGLSCTSGGDLRLTAPIGAWMVIQDRSQLGFKPLVHFSMPTTVQLRKTTTGRPVATIDQISLSSVFHQKYVDEESPNTTIAHDSILERIQPALEAEIENFFSTSQAVQSTQGLTMGCDVKSQILRLVAP